MNGRNLYAFLFLLIMITLLSCKGRVYTARSKSMEATLREGEPFYVKKTGTFERNDIVVFNFYGDDYLHRSEDGAGYQQQWGQRIYRLIALSGDSLLIKEAEVFIDNKHLPLPAGAKMSYLVYSKFELTDLEDDDVFLLKKNGDTLLYHTLLTKKEAEDYEQRKPAIYKIEKETSIDSMPDPMFARSAAEANWNVDNYGPLVIPGPGDTIIVDDVNFKLYHNIPGIKKGPNVITEKLYFVMGDNRHMAEDSRYIGLISQSNMFGVVK